MRHLNATIKLTPKNIGATNLCDLFDHQDLDAIGAEVLEGYKTDKESRSHWEKRNDAAFNLALQVQEAKSFPWPNASNVKFPLVTIAAIQWHSRAYPMLIQGPDLVKVRVTANDPNGQLRESADRVSSFMSYQLLEDSPSWEEETDRGLLQVPIVGCAFKKVYYSPTEGRNVSDLVPAKEFVINYWAKSIETAQRKTHVIPLYRNDVYERVMSEVFRDVLEEEWYATAATPLPDTSQSKTDKRTGMTAPARPDSTTPLRFLEQHVRMDLDGDGYAEPYIITIEETSAAVCRIVANFSERSILWKNEKQTKVIRIREDQYFVKVPFIPSPDGGFYDLGFGVLLGPINESVDTLINQLIDAGTLATTAGGFLGRGVKIRGGEQSFRPFGWNRVDSTGEDLHKGIVPFPVRDPSPTLFTLLSLLIDYTNRVSGSTDIMVGENPGQNTPAQTSQLMAEQGAKINSAIFKRVWRAFKQEYQLLYRLNKIHTPLSVQSYGEGSGWISREDFNHPEEAIRPAADPHLASDTARVQQAMMLKQNAAATPGYNKDAVERLLLRAMKVESIELIFPGSDKVPPTPHPKIILEQMKLQGKAASDKSRLMEKVIQIQADREHNLAEVELIKAQIAEIVSTIGAAQASSQVKAFEAQLHAAEAMDKSYQGYLKILMDGAKDGQGTVSGIPQQPGNAGGQAGPPHGGGGGQGQMGGGGIPPG